jgi:hypothetical protein
VIVTYAVFAAVVMISHTSVTPVIVVVIVVLIVVVAIPCALENAQWYDLRPHP